MTVPLTPRAMTREAFLDWAVLQDGKYEFDGTRVVDMTAHRSTTTASWATSTRRCGRD